RVTNKGKRLFRRHTRPMRHTPPDDQTSHSATPITQIIKHFYKQNRMSALSKCSPLKRKQQGSNTAAKPRALFSGGNPDWPRLDFKDCPDRRLKFCLRKKDKKEYVTCDQNVWSDKDTCKVTLSMLLASKDHPH
ncbi:unnamed protein product, partial [Pylaiella littoralis]